MPSGAGLFHRRQGPQGPIWIVSVLVPPSFFGLYPRSRPTSSIFKNIILRLARAWTEEDDIRNAIKNHLLVLKPEVWIPSSKLLRTPSSHLYCFQAFPAFYDWVAYPVTVLIKKLFEKEMNSIDGKVKPCPFRLELLASLERVLCFCHTGNTTVFATSLMNGLGLSKGALFDGFPMLHPIFNQPSILSAMNDGFNINPRKWPLKDHYPAVASKRAQVLTYSFSHFMVRDPTHHAPRVDRSLCGGGDHAHCLLISFLSHTRLYSGSPLHPW